MSKSKILTVYRKELTDSLRDRRTLISMIVVPILIFPVMTIGIGTVVGKMVLKAQAEIPKVMIVNGNDSPQAVQSIRALKELEVVPTEPDYKQQISDKKIRAAVDIPAGFDAAVERGDPATVSISYYKGDLKSGITADKIEKYFKDLE